LTGSPTTCVLSESGGCAVGTTDIGRGVSLQVTERAALRAWTYSAMRVLEALAAETPIKDTKMQTLRYCHELLIQAMDAEEDRGA
jgi:hypothetical protein